MLSVALWLECRVMAQTRANISPQIQSQNRFYLSVLFLNYEIKLKDTTTAAAEPVSWVVKAQQTEETKIRSRILLLFTLIVC